MKPTVTVIIPTYNSAHFLRESLESVLNQTFKDYEVLVVDDGSQDNTRELLGHNYPMVRYIHQEHSGPATARNAGIKHAAGEFVAFLDADDIWLPTKLEKQIQHFRQNPPTACIFTEHAFFDSKGLCEPAGRKKNLLMKGDLVRNIFRHDGVATPTVMVRRTVLTEVGCFDEDLITAEDENLWMRIAMKHRIDLIDEVLALCRVREGSLTRSEQIFIGVKKHLEVLDWKYPELRRRLDGLIKRKHAIVHFERGLAYFSGNRFSQARAEFMQTLKYRRFNLRMLPYLGCSLLPAPVVEVLRRVRRRILRIQ